MRFDEAMQTLEKAASAQTRKTYARHGVGANILGVSYATLKTLVKKIKVDQALALQLWATGNHDARILATMIADPVAVTSSLLDRWVKDLDNYVLTDALAGLAAKTREARAKAEKWIAADGEWIECAGWGILGRLGSEGKDLPDNYFANHLGAIEKTIHAAKNRVRHSMNMTVICIGIRSPALTKAALAAAKLIGKVEVDHGETGCKTPDAADYIQKTLAHRKKKK